MDANKVPPALMKQLGKLESLAGLFQKEIDTLKLEIASFVTNQPIPVELKQEVAPKVTEMEAVINAYDKQYGHKLPPEVKPEPPVSAEEHEDALNRQNCLKMIVTPLTKYLSPSIYDIGRGFLRPGLVLSQYEEDISGRTPERLTTWPNGFYRDKDTKEIQFFLKALDGNVLIVLGRLPSSNQVPTILVKELGTGKWFDLASTSFPMTEVTARFFLTIAVDITRQLADYAKQDQAMNA